MAIDLDDAINTLNDIVKHGNAADLRAVTAAVAAWTPRMQTVKNYLAAEEQLEACIQGLREDLRVAYFEHGYQHQNAWYHRFQQMQGWINANLVQPTQHKASKQ
jgi:hypothetical protein